MGFLSKLTDTINTQFGMGENKPNSLGKIAESTDKSAERSYIEDGFIRNLRPRSTAILFQQPDIYVIIKKRMFSSLSENSRLDLLENKERILIAASKRLFQNKCTLISAYEKINKIEKLTYESDRFNTFLGPSLLNVLDSGLFELDGKEKSAMEQLRKVLSYAQPGELTNWTVNDLDSAFSDRSGVGTGTFELTNISGLSTTVTTSWGEGNAQLTIEDPYNLMTITEKDIDQALSDVTNPLLSGSIGSFAKFTQIELQKQIDQLKADLALERYNRAASQITFKISNGSIISKKVRAIMDDEGREIIFNYSTGIQNAADGLDKAENLTDCVTSIGSVFSSGSVQIEPEFIHGNNIISIRENNQLNASEKEKFVSIISNIFLLLDQNATNQKQINKNNIEVNYARNRMRLFFQGKYIIQPMDIVSIFMSSRTGEDEKMPGGFAKQQAASGMGVRQKFDTIIKNINTEIHSLNSFNNKGIDFDDVERLSTVGPGMPKWLWRQFKSDITGQPAGPCIFTGIVGKGQQGVTGSWSDGKFTISVPCEDNTGFFDKGQVNFKPSADVFNSSIYDPLTPFDVSFDASTGVALTDIGSGDFPPLLPENQKLLLSGLSTFKSGPNKGTPISLKAYSDVTNELSFDQFKRVLHDADGMVYRWKQGIQTLTKSGRPYPESSTDHEKSVLLTNYPFAGQDIMNVLSLLVTGQPYNYETFLTSAIANGNSLGHKDEASNIPSAITYIQGLLSEIEKNNTIWGNFIPYKTIQMNSTLGKFVAESRLDLVSTNQRLTQKLNERAKLEDEMILRTGGSFDVSSAYSIGQQGKPTVRSDQSSIDTSGSDSYQTKINALSNEIAQLQSEFNSSISANLSLIGNEVSSTLSSTNDVSSTPADKQRDELQMRMMLRKNTARKYWQTKANEDVNLFIVDDQYDKNLDIQAFERKLGGKIELFNSQYSNISDQIIGVKKLLGLEVFANTQGHIEVRPPAYNKIPSTVFYKMFKDRDATGIKVFPDFLENLYFNQVRGIFNQIEIIEDEIRLRAIALGSKNDNDIVSLLTTGGNGSGASEDFGFLTSFHGDGRIGTQNLHNLLLQTTPEFTESWQTQALEELGSYSSAISKNLQVHQLFTPSVQATAIDNFNRNISPDTQTDIIEPIRDRLRIKTGREAATITQLFGNNKFRRLTNQSVSNTDRVNIFHQLSNFISQRQLLLKSVKNAINSLQEGVSINAPDVQNDTSDGVFTYSSVNTSAKSAVTPFLNRKTEIPQFLEHMMEYESDDDLGIGSGRRFIITPDRISSITISENPPPFTMVTVNGVIDKGIIDIPNNFKTSNDGNMITSAYAVDYDMWYQYGFKTSKPIEAPYLSDPDSQCSPYAVAILLESRENILQGSAEINGYNEFYQPGDVIYIEDRGLLFYVKLVKHSFSYNKLSTTLGLCYGHNPGEYIPTMLDVVGKILYNAKGFTGQFRSERFQMLGSARSLGALVVDPTSSETEPMNLLLQGKFGERNLNIMSNMLFAISGSLNKVTFSRQEAKIKIVYYKSITSDSDRMYNLADSIFNWLLNPEQNSSDGLIPISFDNSGNSKQKSFGINSNDIIIEEVDLSDPQKQTRRREHPQNDLGIFENKQGPSTAAISVTRLIDTGESNPDQFKYLLANNVIDIFVDYEIVKENTTSQTNGTSQADQEDNEKINIAKQGLTER